MANKLESFAASYGEKFGLDITTIQMIIEGILSIFERCNQSRSQIYESVKQPSLFHRARATKIVMDHLPNISRFRARQLAINLVNEVQTLDDESRNEIVDICCSQEW